MPEYLVVRPWHGTKKGQTLNLDLKEVNPAFHSNLMLLSEAAALDAPVLGGSVEELPLDDLDTGTTEFDWETVRPDIIAELDDADMKYDETAPAAELAAMLPHEVAEAIKLGAA